MSAALPRQESGAAGESGAIAPASSRHDMVVADGSGSTPAAEVARLEQRLAQLRLGIAETARDLVAVEGYTELDLDGLLHERNLRGSLRALARLYGSAEEQLRKARRAVRDAQEGPGQ